MLNSEASAASAVILLNPQNAADTTAATGPWLDVRQYEGDILVWQHIGALTGQIAGKIQDADSAVGGNSADLAGAAFGAAGTANDLRKLVIPAGSVRGWIRYVGVITTGPCQTEAGFFARPKIV